MVRRELGTRRSKRHKGEQLPAELSIAGPLWTGPLHKHEFLEAMQALAVEWQWTGHAFEVATHSVKMAGHNGPQPLERLLQTLLEESDPRLPAWFVLLRDIHKHACLLSTPPRDALVAALREAGHAASRSHVEVRGCGAAFVLCLTRTLSQSGESAL